MELAIYNIKGEDTGRKAELSDAVFAIEPSEHAVYLAVKQYLANRRQGTHKSKERSEVAGSTRKLHKQKGAGGARIGDINSPVLTGGGRVFGPRPRDYRFKLNKKLKDLARRSALTVKAQDGQITVVEDINFPQPKTKEYMAMARDLNILGKKVLLVLADRNENVYLASRNVPNVDLMEASNLNTYVIMHTNAMVVSESSVAILNEF